ncbi:MAG TPA: DEAD/DEAH box helicase [Thermoanaerobaculia bacterium]
MHFSDFGLNADLLRGVKELGFSRPTPIQTDAIPPAMAGRDVLATAATGSGKTAAFLLPILHKLAGRPRRATRALILTPTRELAAQIDEHAKALAVHTPLEAAAVFGGVAMGPQEHAFRAGVDVLVATPGRLLDHFRFGYARLEALEILVLDEADRMLDMGFLPDIQRVLKHLPPKRQTLFFSATMPPAIASLARQILKDPATVNMERPAAPAAGITQAVYPVPGNLKTQLLAELLSRGDLENALVFTRTKHRANRLYEALAKRGIRAERLHGNRSQAQRTQALAGFKSGRYRVLVATDIAARGIDVEALPHVVNFDVPHVPDDYIHRVGRTARAERTGDAFTFVSPEEEADLRAIEKALGRRLPRVTVPGFDYKAAPAEKLEIPIAERIAAIRARKAAERERAKEKAQRRVLRETGDREHSSPLRHSPAPAMASAPQGRPGAPIGPGRRRRGRRPGGPPRPATGRS